MNNKVFFITLGCPKNTVDSENMMFSLDEAGFTLTQNAEEADIIVINTCAFILDAKEESVSTILDAVEMKKENPEIKIVVTGCLAQGYAEDLTAELPEVDMFLGTGDMFALAEHLKALCAGEAEKIHTDNINCAVIEEGRLLTTQTYAYLKLSEGCNKHCTYCIIPSLRGRQRDRDFDSIIAEAKDLADGGIKEIILIAQDTGEYGTEKYGRRRLAELLTKLNEIEKLKRIRLMYVYPEAVTDELISAMASSSRVMHYIDIPMQHISDSVLKRMGRQTNAARIREIIKSLRSAMPDIAIRSSFIAGFPGESRDESVELGEFFKEAKLTRLGVFAYSREEGTPAYSMEGQISESEKISRKDHLLKIQQDISREIMEGFIGRSLEVLVEEYAGKEDGDNIYVGRSYLDAPDVDGCVYIYTEKELVLGSYVCVPINDCLEYDLIAAL